MDALDRAALVAEGKPVAVVIRATVDDYLELAKLDAKALRDRLDRVVMGEDPEVGLDALLDGGRARRHLARGPRDGRLRRRRVAPQGRVEAHEAGRPPGRAAARGALGLACSTTSAR